MYFCNSQYHRPNFAKNDFFSNICTNILILRQNLRNLLPKLTVVCLLFVFWLLGLSTTDFVIKIVFTLILELLFLTFIIYFILKLHIFINPFIQNLGIPFRNICYVSRNIVNLFYISSSRSVNFDTV